MPQEFPIQMTIGTSGSLAQGLRAKAVLVRILTPVLLVLPILAFYLITFRYTINVPLQDDFGAILQPLNAFRTTHGLFNKIVVLATWQYNDYKLIFENFIAALDLVVFGKVNFMVLQAFGDFFVVLIGIAFYLLWKGTFAEGGDTLRGRAALFAFLPVPYLVFQLNYWSALDFAQASLQHLPVVAFALLCIWSLPKPSRRASAAASILFVLAVFSNANGLLLAPIGAALLLQSRRPWRALAWGALSLALAGLYFYRYRSVQPSPPLLSLPQHISIEFTLSFLGSAFAPLFGNAHLSVVFGGLMLALLVGLLATKAARRNNVLIAYSALFVILTAVGVSAIRSGLGLHQILAIHYRIYSDVFIALCYLLAAQKIAAARPLHAVFVSASIALAMGANLMALPHGVSMLQRRQSILACDVAARHLLKVDVLGIDLPYLPAANSILAQAEALGIYRLPPLSPTSSSAGIEAWARSPGARKLLAGDVGRGRRSDDAVRAIVAECGGVPE